MSFRSFINISLEQDAIFQQINIICLFEYKKFLVE